MKNYVWKLLFSVVTWWQGNCNHDGRFVTADILEGDSDVIRLSVKWCRRCGAVKVVWSHCEQEWKVPRAGWWR